MDDRRFYWSFVRDGVRYERKFDGRVTTISFFVEDPQEALVVSWSSLDWVPRYTSDYETAVAALVAVGFGHWVKDLVPVEAA